MVGTARTTGSRLVMRSAAGTRFAVTVHTVSLEDGPRVVGVFGVMEVDTEYASPAVPSEKLTPRQRQVLVELARGASTEQIAASLGVAPVTVRNHVRGLRRVLGVHSRLEAVAESRRRGLLGP
jgi:DNA-binding NarL/FixJ family response regulator